jgi:hypothetical protein
MIITKLLLGGALALALTAPAAAERTWSDPASLGTLAPEGARAAIGAHGTSVVAWTSERRRLYVRTGDRTGRFGRTQRLATRAEAVPVAAVRADGEALVAWVGGRPRARFAWRCAPRAGASARHAW